MVANWVEEDPEEGSKEELMKDEAIRDGKILDD